ncbi:MAG: hypothetical protein PHH77_04895 [Victivallaceae bacterium]|nr:hypothetical protein [Victivallaceae bacterium]
MQNLKFKTVLFAFAGIILYASQVMLYREMVADGAFPFFSAVFFLLFLAFWTGIGVLLSPVEPASEPYFLFPLLSIPSAGLLSIIAVKLLTAVRPVNSYADLALTALAGGFPLGMLSGITLAAVKHSVSPPLQKYAAFFGAIGYLIAGLILYPLALFNVLTNPLVYTCAANIFIPGVALAVFTLRPVRLLRYRLLTFAALLIAVNLSLLQLEKYADANFFAVRCPDWQLVKSYLTHYSRVSLLTQTTPDRRPSRFLLLSNTRMRQIIPDDCGLYKTAAIPLSLQLDQRKLRVLAIGPRFSYVPTLLSALPYVRRVTLATGDRNLPPLTILQCFSPPPSRKLSAVDSDLADYLRKNRSKFDLIIWLYPDRCYLNFDTLLKLCRLNLHPNGVLAVPASLLLVNNAQNNWRKLFRNRISLPGKALMYAFSDAPLTADLKLLEKRLDKLDDAETRLFPPGTFAIIYSVPHKTTPVILRPDPERTEDQLLKAFVSPNAGPLGLLVLVAAAGFYYLGRFLVLRRHRLQAAAGLFENGLAAMLLMMILMTLYARSEGTFYYNFGVMLTAVSGVPLGLFLSRFKVQRPAIITAVIIIFLSLPYFREYHAPFIPGLAWVNFLCSGIIIAGLFKQNPDAGFKLLSVHFLAGALGAALIFILLPAHFRLPAALFIVVWFRIPLIFSRMTLGKLDPAGGN